MKTVKNAPALTLLLLFLGSSLGALEISANGGAGNLLFESNRNEALGNGTIEPWPYFEGSLGLRGEFSQGLDISAVLKSDPVLRNILSAELLFTAKNMQFTMGPVVGLFNTDEKPINPGISAGVLFTLPAILTIEASIASSVGAGLYANGDYSQETGKVSAGFYLPNVFASLQVDMRSFIEQKTGGLIVKDELVRTVFASFIYADTVPHNVRIDLGWQSLKRTFITTDDISDEDKIDELSSLFAGFDAHFTLHPSLQLTLAFEAPVYSWAEKPLHNPALNTFFFRASTGIIWKIN
ncbi:hypothetical protein FACS1894151_06440 [Spirochaetia bacterium]|nr:hypothetical protein FACS1894151_06440 [Spirochaetia bacterium]